MDGRVAVDGRVGWWVDGWEGGQGRAVVGEGLGSGAGCDASFSVLLASSKGKGVGELGSGGENGL